MIYFTKQLQELYEKDDQILDLMNQSSLKEDRDFTTHRWLLESLPKRMVFYYLYGDLLQKGNNRLKILDVGGGYSSLTRTLIDHHDYQSLDIMIHDDHNSIREAEASIGTSFWINSEWSTFSPDEYDIVIANDLFPNVDQRIEMFIDNFLPYCAEMRLSLTYFNSPHYYTVKRIDADEVFHIQAWDGFQVRHILEKYRHRIDNYQPELLLENPPCLYPNKRQVCYVTLYGDKS
ncbi:hypothetical protein ACFL47_01310 [Candidatus Latescibacterota bacterium]